MSSTNASSHKSLCSRPKSCTSVASWRRGRRSGARRSSAAGEPQVLRINVASRQRAVLGVVRLAARSAPMGSPFERNLIWGAAARRPRRGDWWCSSGTAAPAERHARPGARGKACSRRPGGRCADAGARRRPSDHCIRAAAPRPRPAPAGRRHRRAHAHRFPIRKAAASARRLHRADTTRRPPAPEYGAMGYRSPKKPPLTSGTNCRSPGRQVWRRRFRPALREDISRFHLRVAAQCRASLRTHCPQKCFSIQPNS